MAKTGIYVSLDIGTTSIKVVVAEYIENQINIIGVGNAKSKGLDRGIVIDIDKAVQSVQRAIKQAEEKSGVQIKSVSVGIPANLLEVEKCEGMIAVNSESKEITDKDVKNVASAAVVRSTPPERQVITLIPQEFKVDGFEGIKDPRGMIGVRLDMKGLLYTGPKTIVHNIQKCVEKAGLVIDEMVITPLALASSILSDGEKDFGTTIIDMGGGQTTTSVMYERELKFSHVEQEGGEFVTKDISVVLNTSLTNAEALKINYGYAYPERTSPNEEFPVDVIGKNEPVRIDERYLSEIIEARVEQIFSKSKMMLDSIDALNLPGGVILTGGAASLPGVVELAADMFGTNVKLYVPNHMGLRNPVYANAIAIVEYVAQLDEVYHVTKLAVTGGKKRTAKPVRETSVETKQHEKAVQQAQEPVTEMPANEPVKEKEEGFGGKVKGFLSNIFD